MFTHTRMLSEILENAHLLFFIFLSQSVIFLDVLFSCLTVSTLSLMFESSAFKAFTRRAFSRRFYPKRLTISTFCQKKRGTKQHISVGTVRLFREPRAER